MSLNGIYIWDIERQNAAGFPPTPQDLPASWAEELRTLGPWENLPAPGGGLFGQWRRSSDPNPEHPIVISPDCSSSLDLAGKLISGGLLPEWASVLAVRQRIGRGRQGRSWESPPGNMHAALRLPLPGAAWRDAMPLAVASAVAASMAELGVEPFVKWPNDLLLAGNKVGGILIEDRDGSVLAGIGLNLASAPPASRLRRDQSIPAGSLAEHGYVFSPLALWRHVAETCRATITHWMAKGSPAGLVGMFDSRLAYLRSDVIVSPSDGGPEYRAFVLGTDPSGGLRVRSEQGDLLVTSASIYPIAT